MLGIGKVTTTAFAVVVDCPRGPVGLATTGIPERGVLDQPVGESELPGTSGLYHMDGRVVVLINPASLLTPERVGGAEFRNDLASFAVG
jgi:hypothetical protein